MISLVCPKGHKMFMEEKHRCTLRWKTKFDKAVGWHRAVRLNCSVCDDSKRTFRVIKEPQLEAVYLLGGLMAVLNNQEDKRKVMLYPVWMPTAPRW